MGAASRILVPTMHRLSDIEVFMSLPTPLCTMVLGSTALLGAALSAAAQEPVNYPTITFTPTVPISTEPLTIVYTSTLPDGAVYNVNVSQYSRPHGPAGSCTAVQKNGVALCRLGRILPGLYRVDTSGGDGYVQPITLTVASPGDNTVSALQGQYAFFVTSPSKGNGTALSGGAAAGSFTADGTGKISSGVVDLNTPRAAYQNLAVTGTYRLNGTGQGTVTLQTAQGTLQFAVNVPTAQTLSNIVSGNLAAVPGSLVGGGGTLVNQSGLIQSLAPVDPGFAPYLSDAYASTLAGENSPAPVALGGAAQFAFTPTGSVVAAGSFTIDGAPVDFAGLEGTYSSVDPRTGRAVMSFGAPGQAALSFVLYETSQQSFNFLSLGAHSGAPLIAGTAEANQ